MFCGTAEPATPRGSSASQIFYPHASHKIGTFPPQNASSPAHGVIVIGVTEAGGFQLAAHHGAGALIPRQVALEPTLTVHAGTCDTTDKPNTCPTCWFRPRFSFVGLKFLTPPRFDDISIFTLFGRWTRSLTVLLHALSVSRSLSPEGNHRLRFSLFVKGLHTACSIWTINGGGKKDIESNNQNVKQNKSKAM